MTTAPTAATDKAPIEELVNRCQRAKQTPHGYIAQCPAHDDGRPSLSVFFKGGRWHVHCFAGCSLKDIQAAVGLERLDLTGGNGVAQEVAEPERPTRDELTNYARACFNSGGADSLAAELGVTATSLEAMKVGWSAEKQAWTLPMRNGDGHVVGIQYRAPDGRQWCYKGSQLGLFVASAYTQWHGALVVTEGASDCAAAMDMGLYAVGRPNKDANRHYIELFCMKPLWQALLIVRDRDEGDPNSMQKTREAADELAHAVAAAHKEGKGAESMKRVKVVAPPAGYKDLRKWYLDGATRDDLYGLATNAESWI